MCKILREYLGHREAKSDEERLFTNVFGQPRGKSTCYSMLYFYNKNRGVTATGIHRYRHTFAKQWISNGGNVVSLSKILEHSNLSITQRYVNLLVSDLAKQVEEVDLLGRFAAGRQMRM